jgi:hypothetical protein
MIDTLYRHPSTEENIDNKINNKRGGSINGHKLSI